MLATLLHGVRHVSRRLAPALSRHLLTVTQPPVLPARLVVATRADLPRVTSALIAENALLRQQRVVPQRSVTRVHCMPIDRALLVLLASRVRAGRLALLIVQPETLLRWRR